MGKISINLEIENTNTVYFTDLKRIIETFVEDRNNTDRDHTMTMMGYFMEEWEE